jgi:hypothetical protein
MLDQRGQLLRAAIGFATCSMPSYDRALHALRTWLDSWAGIGARRRGDAPPGLRSAIDAVSRPTLAGHLLYHRLGTQPDCCDRHRVGAQALARDVAGGARTLKA